MWDWYETNFTWREVLLRVATKNDHSFGRKIKTLLFQDRSVLSGRFFFFFFQKEKNTVSPLKAGLKRNRIICLVICAIGKKMWLYARKVKHFWNEAFRKKSMRYKRVGKSKIFLHGRGENIFSAKCTLCFAKCLIFLL